MRILTDFGVVLVMSGLVGLFYCIRQGIRVRRAGLPPEAIAAALQRLLPINLGSVALAALGLALMLAGLIL